MTVLEDMIKAWEQLMPPIERRAYQIRAGTVAAPALPYALGAQGIDDPSPAQRFSGIPIIIDHQLPPFYWKVVDQYGTTMLEGELTVELDF